MLKATIKAGSALVYDSRIIHCGSAHHGRQSRPALVLRWDRVGEWPPGVGVAGTMAIRVVGGAVSALADLRPQQGQGE